MKTFKEYYKKAYNEHLKWLYDQKEEWWKKENTYGIDILSPKGEYLETVNFLTNEEKNDSSLFHNHTNVKNSEWGIFFDMLGQALIDWCIENKATSNLYSFHLYVDREIDIIDDLYHIHWSIYPYNVAENEVGKKIEDPEQFKECADFLTGLLNEFMARHSMDIPLDWNHFSFGLDDLQSSIKYGEWVCSSDGYIDLGNIDCSNPERKKYDNFVACM